MKEIYKENARLAHSLLPHGTQLLGETGAFSHQSDSTYAYCWVWRLSTTSERGEWLFGYHHCLQHNVLYAAGLRSKMATDNRPDAEELSRVYKEAESMLPQEYVLAGWGNTFRLPATCLYNTGAVVAYCSGVGAAFVSVSSIDCNGLTDPFQPLLMDNPRRLYAVPRGSKIDLLNRTAHGRYLHNPIPRAPQQRSEAELELERYQAVKRQAITQQPEDTILLGEVGEFKLLADVQDHLVCWFCDLCTDGRLNRWIKGKVRMNVPARLYAASCRSPQGKANMLPDSTQLHCETSFKIRDISGGDRFTIRQDDSGDTIIISCCSGVSISCSSVEARLIAQAITELST